MKIFGFGILLLLAALAIGCHQEEPMPVIPTTSSNHVRFDSLQVGQKSKYLIFEAGWFLNSLDTSITFSNDTLVLEIVSQDSAGYLCKESLSYQDSVSVWFQHLQEKTYSYYIRVENDSLKFSPIAGMTHIPSYLFDFFTLRYGLELTPYTGNRTKLKGWQVDLLYDSSDKRAYIQDGFVAGQHYEHLNVLMLNAAMASDSPGSTTLYNAQSGIVQFCRYSIWTFQTAGLALVP